MSEPTKFEEIFMDVDIIKKVNILMRLKVDPNYIEKAKASICKDCSHCTGFEVENYGCDIAMKVRIDNKREGVFHTQIIKCSHFDKKKLSMDELNSMLTTLEANLKVLEEQVDQLRTIIRRDQ